MSLPLLYIQPDTPEEWSAWSFNHSANHIDWVRLALQEKNQQIAQYQLDPMDPSNLGFWLYTHQEMHNQINAVLGTSGYDLLSLDWQDPDQFALWLQQNGDEHQRISAALGVG